jgi:beta-phosphoglucomutase family hydrolase
MTEAMPFLANFESEIPPNIKGLIFDCDGTLIDTMPIHYRAWLKALARYGVAFSEKRFYSFAGMPTRRIVETLAAEQKKKVDAAKIAHEKEEIYLAMMPMAAPIEQVLALARREKGRRKLAVASGGYHHVVEKALTAMHCVDLFETIVGADEVEHGKPYPDMFLEAARRIGLKPEQCLVFEDAELGFQAARAAGMKAVDVRPWYLPRAG